MSDNDKHILSLVKQVLNEELRSIVSVFQANQPTETSKVTHLISEVIIRELQPIKEHLSKQDSEIKDIKDKIELLTKDTAPLVEGKKTVSSIFKFVLWGSPIGIVYGFYKWLKL